MNIIEIEAARRRRYLMICRILSLLSALAGALYLKWLVVDAQADNKILFGMLLAAELFNLLQAAGFWFTISWQVWPDHEDARFAKTKETVDIFVTVCGEPVEIIEKTVSAALMVRHPRKAVWVLDDGRSEEVRELTARLGAGYLTRADNRGAKAGNMNEAMKRTNGDYIVVFDADHVPVPEFLERTMGAFVSDKIAFVQTPQVYENRFENRVAAGAHHQQGLFYGPIMRGKNSTKAVFSCGTNVVFRRRALDAVGGMPEDSITEDLRVSLLLVKAGYHAVYVPEILARGLGPLDVGNYFKQQFRWARGGLEILLKRGPLNRGMDFRTAVQFSLGFVYWFTGWAYAAYLVLPVAYLVFGVRPVMVPNQYPVYFLPYLVMTLVTIAYASNFRLTFSAIWFTLASFPTHIAAFFSALLGGAARFVVTSKTRGERSLRPVAVHIAVIAVLLASVGFALRRDGITPSVANNIAFALGHIIILQGFVRYARRPESHADEALVERRAEASASPESAYQGEGL